MDEWINIRITDEEKFSIECRKTKIKVITL